MSEIIPISDIEKRRFAAKNQPGQTDISIAIKRCAVQDLKDCSFSREEVAEELAAAVGRPITGATIDALVAETKTRF